MRWIVRLAKNNAELLTKRDTMALFNRIVEELGSISKACDLVGIERKTYYNWKENVKTITTENKIKVLNTALELNTIDTLEFLTEKSFKRTCRLLYTTLSTIHDKILDSKDLNEKKLLCDKFFIILRKYNEPITEVLNTEINDMIINIKNAYPDYFEKYIKFEQKFEIESTDESQKSINVITKDKNDTLLFEIKKSEDMEGEECTSDIQTIAT